MVKWKAAVEGHDVDLATLRECFASPDVAPRIAFAVDDQGTHFEAERLDQCSDDDRPAVAARILREANGIARLLDSDFRPVSLAHRYWDGSGSTQIFVADAVEIRERVTISASGIVEGGARAKPTPSFAEQLLEAADGLSDVREVLVLFGNPAPVGWGDLYKVYEIIRASVGGGPALFATGWTTKPEASRFTLSANHQAVSGSEARHARLGAEPPDRPMTLMEARAFITRLAHSWVKLPRG